jgi:hypothetical protein
MFSLYENFTPGCIGWLHTSLETNPFKVHKPFRTDIYGLHFHQFVRDINDMSESWNNSHQSRMPSCLNLLQIVIGACNKMFLKFKIL